MNGYNLKHKALNYPLIMIVLIFLSGGLFILQRAIDTLHKVKINKFDTLMEDTTYEVMYLVSGKIVKPLTLGFDQLIADLLWIRAVNYFGSHYITNRYYPWLYHLLDIVTTLDPKFIKPYMVGSIILATEAEEIDNSNKLLMKGMEHNPEVWQIPFYLGFNLFHYQNKPDEAAKYIKIASELPGHPVYLPLLASTLHSKSGDIQTAITFLREVYKNTTDENIRRMIRAKMEDILKTP